MKKEDFYTVPKANAGIKLPLLKEDGSESGQWLLVRGTDSDAFRKSSFESSQAVSKLPEDMGDWERSRAIDEVILNDLVSLVAGWSFKDPCTPESVRLLLKNAPQIAVAIDQIAADRSKFYGGKPAK
ncbi:hypothetical protein QAO71_15750 [Halopseudomonas sp. SMJS2]|uniref:hypothetical protein n=1 Tax=Halopseudomonas sp. SMJS2 TaxID=3041098 RepID=UPI0024533ADB|nr:hypothetical protein [Halopseudomonas sp. SMJS2]WGK61479.1 hypothetical protein QAO71_15750 [Halopseudomonas sp. SMJS2]